MKNKILILLIFVTSGCSSIPRLTQNDSIDTLIQKPDLNYKTNSLPKVINIFYSNEREGYKLPDEVQGFLENYYFYKSKIQYQPKLTLISLDSKSCNNQNYISDLNIIFDISHNQEIFSASPCLKTLTKSKTLFVSNKDNDALSFGSYFFISRKKEEEKLLNLISSKNNIAVIDSTKTLDAPKIIQYLVDQDKTVAEQRTYSNKQNSQNMFSEVLMVDRSKERLRKLSRRLSLEISGNPRTRKDIDTFVFSVGLDTARNLKPALEYITENELEIFILNDWESNIAYDASDKDLIGSINSDIPFMMPIKAPDFLKSSKRTREFAIGYDTFEIIMLKYGRSTPRNFEYKGLTGKLDISGQIISRKPYVFKVTDKGINLL